MKYVIFKNQETGIKHVILCAEHTTHSTVKIDESYDGKPGPKIEPISAGFWGVKNKEVVVFGESTSLDLKPKEGDVELIQATLQNMGIYAFI